jgi:hypothetical protein
MSAATNISQAVVGGLEESVGASHEGNRMFISGVVTHKCWYSRFMVGIHKEVGQVCKPDQVLTIDVIHAADRIWRMKGLMQGEQTNASTLLRWVLGLVAVFAWVSGERRCI